MIQSHTFRGLQDGPHVLFFGAIHGNEPAGARALQRLVHDLEHGTLRLQAGRVTCIPVCNPRAYDRKSRYVDENLNRCFTWHDTPVTYEQELANMLVPYVQDCDYLIDLHSVTADSPPFCFLDYDTPANRQLIQMVGAPHVVTGWAELYDGTSDISTQHSAHQYGKPAITIECGQHNDPASYDQACRFVSNVLEGMGLIETGVTQAGQTHPQLYRMQQVVFKSDGMVFQKDYRNFQPVNKGELIVRGTDDAFHAPSDGAIIMPSPNTKVGEDMFYFATVGTL